MLDNTHGALFAPIKQSLGLLWLCVTLSMATACGNPTNAPSEPSSVEPVQSRHDGVETIFGLGEDCDPEETFCESSHCIDGVCCDSECDGFCMGCTNALTGGDSGYCRPIADNTSPTAPKTEECAVDPANVCGPTGYCSGTLVEGNTTDSTCQYASIDVTCGQPACINGDVGGGQQCNGVGACVPASVVEQCGLYWCQMGDEGPYCPDGCTDDSQCDTDAGAWCHPVTEECVTGKKDGEDCTQSHECGSGYCIDGVCCRTDCDSTCFSCNGDYTGETSGYCEEVTAGLNWGKHCTPTLASTCGLSGKCDGSGACANYGAETECSTAYCTGSDAYGAATCSGAGACDAGTLTAHCVPYNCNAGSCYTTCDRNEHCATDYRCYIKADNSVKFCTDLKLDGEACDASPECASEHCVDGVCCENACDSTCMACNRARTDERDGRCHNIKSDSDPDDECSNPECTNPSGGKFLSEIPRSTCDEGACTSVSASSCAPFTCSGVSCNTSCPSDLNGVEHANCAPLTPYCFWGYCYDNQRPVANAASHNAAQASTTTLTLTGSDPDGDTIYFELVNPPATVTMVDSTAGTVSYTPNSCRGNDFFKFRVYDRASSEGRLYSEPAWITLTITNVNPTISDIGNGNSLFGSGISKSFTYADLCDSASNLTVSSSIHSGDGSASVTGVSNGNGTVNWTPATGNLTVDAVCRGNYCCWGEQSATVAVTVKDYDNATSSDTFNVQMSAAQQCEDFCTTHFLWCQTEEIRPTNCRYCQDLYSTRCKRHTCSRCCTWWGWPCWNCNCRCAQYEDYVSGNSCDQISSTEGFFFDFLLFFADAFCDWFGIFCTGERCWWD